MTTILDEAKKIVNGARQKAYGSPQKNYERVAVIWSVILGVSITPQQVVLCMIGLKIARESHRHKRDNTVDIAGYAELLDRLS